MKALSLWQPWATLIAIGAKRIETRSWATAYRGPLAIHAGKKQSRAIDLVCINDPYFRQALAASGHLQEIGDELTLSLPVGVIVATCRLVDVRPTQEVRESLDPAELAFGNYAAGRFAWGLADVQPLPIPIRVDGFQRLFNVPDDLLKDGGTDAPPHA